MMERQNLSADQLAMAKADFTGSKLCLFMGDQLAVIRRDDKPGLAFANCLDLPGGMREPGETPEACALRELFEELGLVLTESDLVSPMFYDAPCRAWFFCARIAAERAQDVVFGDEGQGWCLMDPWAFVRSDEAVPHFRERVRAYLAA